MYYHSYITLKVLGGKWEGDWGRGKQEGITEGQMPQGLSKNWLT